VRFAGKDVLKIPADELPEFRGNEAAMIFQDPMTSLNPVFTVEKQLGEVLRLRFGLDRHAARGRAIEMLESVGERVGSYPHELSGGMKQRVMIAMALLSKPRLLIADEPTTALDVTIQAQILQLIRDLQKESGTAVLFITHDMGVIAQMCDDVAVMYAGRVVEQGSVKDIFGRSAHPYTRGLLRSVPRRGVGRKADLPTIEGMVPSLIRPPGGCRFADRCDRRRGRSPDEQTRCYEEDPRLHDHGASHVACHYPLDGAAS
jgi:peptide/nickel transport system ATP-binding protein